jgi:hypothetical protein
LYRYTSVKNFQLVHEEDLEHVMLQFGKVGKDMFTMGRAVWRFACRPLASPVRVNQ